MNDIARNLRIVGFRVESQPKDQANPNLGSKLVEYVDTTSVGNAKYTVTPWRIVDVMRDTSGLWDVIKPHYDAWKKGEEIPTTGTPLAAWQGISRHQIEAVRVHGIYTVEDMAQMTDAVLQKVGGLGLAAVREAARAWDAAKDTRNITAHLAEKDAEIAELKAQMSDLMELIRSGGAVAKDDEETVKRRPGRPRKEDVAA